MANVKSKTKTKTQPINLGPNLNQRTRHDQPKPAAATEAEMAEPSMIEIVWLMTKELMPSTRDIIAYVAHIGVMAVGTMAAWSLVNSMLIGAVTLSAGMFLAFIVGLITMILAVWVSSKAGRMIANYISSGAIDRHVTSLKDSIFGVFSARPAVTG